MLEKLKKAGVKSEHFPEVGARKGLWLAKKVNELRPMNILELGTANGYSGCILGSQGAQLVTIEHREEAAKVAMENFGMMGIRAELIIGDAVEEIKKLKGPFGIIFIDFAKNRYIEVLEDCIKLTRPGSFIIADNITKDGCKNFKEAIMNHKKLRTSIVNIGDGLSKSIRL